MSSAQHLSISHRADLRGQRGSWRLRASESFITQNSEERDVGRYWIAREDSSETRKNDRELQFSVLIEISED